MSGCQDVALFIDDDLLLDQWQFETLQRMVSETEADISLVVVNEGVEDEDSTFEHIRRRLREHWPWVPVSVLQRHSRKMLGPPKHRRSVHLDDTDLALDAERLFVTPIKLSHFAVGFPNDAVDRIAESADVAMLFGFGIIKGDILDAPDHGILSFHHGDMRKYRGSIPGFWELLHGEDRVGITLQRLDQSLDSGDVVVYDEIEIESDDTWQSIKRKLYGEKSRRMLTEGINRLNSDDFSVRPIEEVGEIYTHPKRPVPVLKYLLVNYTHRLKRLW